MNMNYLVKCFQTVLVVFLLFSSCKKEPGPDEMKDAAGNIYKTVTIGNQVWMAENLSALYINKPNGSYSLDGAINADFWFPDDAPATISDYGLLYSFAAAKNLLPKNGWRIPTLQDFDRLLQELGTNYVNGGNAVVAALNIIVYPGSNDEEIFSIDKYFSFLLDEPALSVSFDYLTLRIHARDYPDDEIFRREIYWCNATRHFASSVRFVKDAD
jgi:uncharacterized protein (TIGR02145 family)